MKYIISFLSLLVPFVAYADVDCDTPPACETLGYILNENCTDGKCISCPFDTNYKRRIVVEELNCADLNYTEEDKTSWCIGDKYKILECSKNAELTICIRIAE